MTDHPHSKSARHARLARARRIRRRIAMAVAVLVAMILAWNFFLAPKRMVPFVTGQPQNQYYKIGLRYREFCRNWVNLDIRSSNGSVDNYRQLIDPKSDVVAAIVQGGSAPPEARNEAVAVAAIYYEPVWVFYRGADCHRLSDLRGKTIAVGREGSGVKPLSTLLLKESGVRLDGPNAAKFVEFGDDQAASMLIDGNGIDAAFFVISPHASIIRRLLSSPSVKLMNWDEAPAYCRRHPFLSPVTLHAGSIDMENRLPTSDVNFVAASAMLVVRKSADDALIQLLIRAARDSHADNNGGEPEEQDLLAEQGTFPSITKCDLPVHEHARNILTDRFTLLDSLPFSVASLIERWRFVLLPLLGFWPILMSLKSAYGSYERILLSKWYRRLRHIEDLIAKGHHDKAQHELEILEERTSAARLRSCADQLYELRAHIAGVHERLSASTPFA